MKTFRASIDVMPHDNLLDPQGKAVTGAMGNLGLPEITGVRIGKHITLHVEAADKKTAEAKVDDIDADIVVGAPPGDARGNIPYLPDLLG